MKTKSVLKGPVDESRGNKFFAVAAALKQRILKGKLSDRLPGTPALAREFGVTRITLNKALSVLKEEGLVYSVAGRGTYVTRLKRPRTHVLGGVLGSAEGGPLTSQLLLGIQRAGSDLGEATVFLSHHDDPAQELKAVKELVEKRQVDGVLLWPAVQKANGPAIRYLRKLDFPFVVVVVTAPDVADVCSTIGGDDAGATRAVTEHLIAAGHERIGFIASRTATDWRERRLRQFQETMRENRLQATTAVCVSSLEKLTAPALRRSLSRFTAALCDTDRTAARLLRQCLRVGLRVPEDLAVSGYDNTEVARLLDLTTVEQHFDRMGRSAVEVLVKQIDGVRIAPRHVRIESELIVRSSTA